MTEPALVGLAHGSRDSRAAVAIGELMAAVSALRPGLAAVPAFLDLSEPDLTTALRRLGSREAVVVPLLFGQAFHARVDVPEAVARAVRDLGVTVHTTPILGLGPAVLRALQHSAARAGIADTTDILLLGVGSSRAEANQAVVALAEQWTALRSAPVHAAFAAAEPAGAATLAGLRAAGRDVGVVPLFLAPGLLLDQVAGSTAAAGLTVAEPLGTLVAKVVLTRYDEATTAR